MKKHELRRRLEVAEQQIAVLQEQVAGLLDEWPQYEPPVPAPMIWHGILPPPGEQSQQPVYYSPSIWTLPTPQVPYTISVATGTSPTL